MSHYPLEGLEHFVYQTRRSREVFSTRSVIWTRLTGCRVVTILVVEADAFKRIGGCVQFSRVGKWRCCDGVKR